MRRFYSLFAGITLALGVIVGSVQGAAAMPGAPLQTQPVNGSGADRLDRGLVQDVRLVCNGYGRCWHTHPRYRRGPPGIHIGPGGIFVRPPVYRPRPHHYGGYSHHVRWCLERYRSYNPATDRYTGYDGRSKRCHSPY
jgi:hypothetical protein